jgi:hypothetical protein
LPRTSQNASPSLWKAVADHARLVEGETETQLRQTHVIRRAQGFAWTSPANDNQAWPLLKALRQDGNEALVRVAERYRALWDRAHQVPMGTAQPNDLFVVPKYAAKDDPDNRTRGALETAHTDGEHAGGKVLRETGAVAEKRIRDGTPNPPRRATSRVRTDHTEDTLISIIDARRDLARLHAALGPLVDAFEEAVVDCSTLAEVGASRGIGQHAGGAGKLVVMMGMEAVQAELARIDRERRAVA